MPYNHVLSRDLKDNIYVPTEGIKAVICVGAVGQPRDLDPRACYVVHNTGARIVEYRRVEYDHETAAKKIENDKSAGLKDLL